MAYDYSIPFLERHQELVHLVTEAYRTRTQYTKGYGDDPQALARDRHLVSNILRSLALNFPDEYHHIRRALRTWVTRESGEWMLHIGIPQHKMAGRLPGGSTPTSGWIGTTPPPMPAQDSYTHDQTIGTMEEFQRFTGKVLELPPETNQVTAEFADVIENLEPFEAMFGDQWTIAATGPTTLQLTRR